MGKTPGQQDLLRKEAEALLAGSPPTEMPIRSAEEVLHELQVHQIELEMQNDELRRALLTIEESRDRYVDLYEFSPVGYLTLSSNGMIAEINLSGAALLGVERKKLLNRRFDRFVCPEDGDNWHQHFMSVLQHDWQRCELALKRGDGSVFHAWLDSRKINVGNESSIRVSLIDISERKRMEQELRLKEFALNHASDAVYLIDQDLRFVYVNEEACRALGYSRDELLGLTPSDIDPDVTPEDVLRIREQTLDGGSFTFETRHRRRDGSQFPVEIRDSVFEYQGQTMNIALVRDISERKQLAQKEFFATILENALDVVVVMNSNGVITEWNSQAEKIFGWSRDEACGLLMHETIIPLHYREAHVRGMGHFLFSGEGPALNTRIEIMALHRDGHEFPVELSISPIKTAEGYEFSSFIRDITERKRLEQKRLESKTRYQQMFDNAASIGFLIDPESGIIVDANVAASAFLGYTREELQGTHISRVNTASREEIHAVLKRFRDKQTHCHETRHKLKNGEVRDVEVYSGPLDVQGRTLLYSVVHDITERKLAEAALSESETCLRLLEQREIVQTSLDGFWVVRADDERIIEANDAFCNMVGYTREELLTMSILDLEANESPAETAAHIKTVMEVGNHRFETRHRHKQGHLVNLEISVSHSELDGSIFFVFVRDITERLHAEKSLRESESRFRTLFESATDCMLILDKDGRIIDINRTGYERLGYQEQEMLGRRVAEFDTPECAALVPEHMADIAKEGKATFESAHVRKDGTVMPIEISSRIIHLDGEQRYFSVIRDISKRKLAEQDLRLKEFVLDHARDAVYLINLDLRFVYVNEEACRALGYSRDELLGLTPSDIDPETTPEDARRIWKQMFVRGHITFETRHRRRDGSQFPVEIQGASFEYQGQTMNMALARDISERKRVELEVAELRNRNELILNAAGDGICGINAEGRINFINPAAAKMLGYSAKELLGLSLDGFSCHARVDDYACPVANCKILISSNRNNTTCRKGEDVFLRKDGSIFPVSYTRAPITDKRKCIGSVVMFRDITERKRAEQHVRELSAHLNTVREEEKAHLAREIHDELGSTLSALKIETQLLDRGLSAEQKKMPLFARVESMVELLNEAVKATRHIITDLRPSVLDDLGLMAALEWQAEQFHLHTGIKCQVICIDSEDKGCMGCKDCEYTLDKALSINLFRIFQESLTNVARHSGASRVEVELQPCIREVALSVSDNGHGLAQGHVMASTSYGIRGMRERVEQLGGKIEFDSQPGDGFRVMVRLPQPAGSKKYEPASHGF